MSGLLWAATGSTQKKARRQPRGCRRARNSRSGG